MTIITSLPANLCIAICSNTHKWKHCLRRCTVGDKRPQVSRENDARGVIFSQTSELVFYFCFVCTCYVLRAQNMAIRRSFCTFWNPQMHDLLIIDCFLFCRHSCTVSDKKTFSPRTPADSWSKAFETQSAWEIFRPIAFFLSSRPIFSQARCVANVLDHESSGVRGEKVFLSLTVQSKSKY